MSPEPNDWWQGYMGKPDVYLEGNKQELVVSAVAGNNGKVSRVARDISGRVLFHSMYNFVPVIEELFGHVEFRGDLWPAGTPYTEPYA